MFTPDRNHIPDRSWSEIKTIASSIAFQGGIEKYITGKEKRHKVNICKKELTVGTWNVRTLHKAGKVKELEHELQRYTWNVIGLAEIHEKGVGFIVNKNTIRSVLECTPISSRIIRIRIKARPLNLTIIQIYAPTGDYEDNDVELFYQELDEVIQKANKKDVLIIQGDRKAKVGAKA
ncbi:craniofacial development protein 2-like [Penaeus vannamei]|uniref:craniofacial development protein 2-like n=1 Tax=Penaeus vannamei TaxID=6689 RepID=UPI00387F4DCD